MNNINIHIPISIPPDQTVSPLGVTHTIGRDLTFTRRGRTKSKSTGLNLLQRKNYLNKENILPKSTKPGSARARSTARTTPTPTPGGEFIDRNVISTTRLNVRTQTTGNTIRTPLSIISPDLNENGAVRVGPRPRATVRTRLSTISPNLNGNGAVRAGPRVTRREDMNLTLRQHMDFAAVEMTVREDMEANVALPSTLSHPPEEDMEANVALPSTLSHPPEEDMEANVALPSTLSHPPEEDMVEDRIDADRKSESRRWVKIECLALKEFNRKVETLCQSYRACARFNLPSDQLIREFWESVREVLEQRKVTLEIITDHRRKAPGGARWHNGRGIYINAPFELFDGKLARKFIRQGGRVQVEWNTVLEQELWTQLQDHIREANVKGELVGKTMDEVRKWKVEYGLGTMGKYWPEWWSVYRE
ncbi:hypothetical protein TREMEDRAFT_66460 [Tremella mesenterica DSM 1558]|uniref:uncharacterized protein n=1 Tax=Tremella mesenterica (strain ATCC 24925 / CBS 8224 / DSM 1558 / NBRC 9311 / NRRL Y-6157 / RJB 2259-6 / UBC 559-6) TaxID=578456 RepID=UPI00032BBCBE|nr:uncharacterized protein TREMEDRAFT_66460 [Tremella mesenterica DSM 1558]EIW65547.1 hypothetical protein TREMEDRAFT_66460 [Tremella mesenterica DSM 1558]